MESTITNTGDEQLQEMQLLVAKNAALETAIAEKDAEISAKDSEILALEAQVSKLKATDKSSVDLDAKPVALTIPTDTVKVKGISYRSKRAAFWHDNQKVIAAEFVKDKSFFAELVALYPSEFVEVD
jgi:hypothetical protein